MNNPDWAGGVLRYRGKTNATVLWVITLILCAVCIPVLLNLKDIWQQHGWIVLAVLLFPLLVIAMLYQAVKMTLEWRRFGDTPLHLKPFPGQIGGMAGGEIMLKTAYEASAIFKISLSCLRSYMSGSGEDRSRNEKLIWHDVCPGQGQPTAGGMRVQFRFNVPDNLPPSETQHNDYHLWRLNIHGAMRGVDLQRNFEIPVYCNADTDAQNQALLTDYKAQNLQAFVINELIPLQNNGTEISIYYPVLRKPLSAFAIQLFGAIFAGSGWFLWHQAGTAGFMFAIPYFMGVIFSLVGVIILICGIYLLVNSLHIHGDGRQVTAIRRVLGLVISHKSTPYFAIKAINIENKGSSQIGGKHTAHYEIHAITPKGKIILAEQIDAYSKAEFIAEYYRQLFNINESF